MGIKPSVYKLESFMDLNPENLRLNDLKNMHDEFNHPPHKKLQCQV